MESGENQTIERLPIPPTPPPIRAERVPGSDGPPPPRAGSAFAAPASTHRSPQASANPVELLGPAGVVRSTSNTIKYAVFGVSTVLVLAIVVTGVLVARTFSGTAFVSNLEPGDCLANFFDQGADGEYIDVFLVETVPCEEPHALEVYAVSEYFAGESTYPGLDEAFFAGQDWCFARYDEFVGGDYYVSDYEVWTFVPDDQSWRAGDRSVQCLVGQYDQLTMTTGTLEGADR